ncbi:MAG: KEOPS complex subunit Cgi121 [Candidatus Heimdallarchaeota archaeon]
MIIKKFSIEEKAFFIGIEQFKIKSKNLFYEQFFNTFENIQKKYKSIVIQVFNDEYVLNSDHILNACYYVEKAFLNNYNISNKKNIELFLYLAANRQIKIALEDFGLNKEAFNKGLINLCSISSESSFQSIYEFETTFKINNSEYYLDNYSQQKYKEIKLYHNFSDNQIETVLASYNIKINLNNINDSDLPNLYLALNDLICEKMALIYLEKFSFD